MSLPEINKKPYEQVKDEKVSVIIVARNEKLLELTVSNFNEMAEGPVEFIVFLDGKTKYPFNLEADNIIVRRNDGNSIGRRPATNQACSLATGKYLFHVDAHCKTNVKGWDTIFKQLCLDDRTMVIPALCSLKPKRKKLTAIGHTGSRYDMDKLEPEDFIIKGNAVGHKYIDVRYKDQWSGKKTEGRNEYTITGNGMGWFLEKKYFDAFNGCCKKQPDRWGNFGVEWASKVWLSDPYGQGVGGKVILSGEVLVAHMWKNGGTGYSTPGVPRGRRDLFKWHRGEGENQCRTFDFFETELRHLIPSKVKKVNKRPLLIDDKITETIYENKYAVTAIMNTNGLYPELDAEAIESFLRQDYEDKHLIIVSTNSTYRLDKPYGNITVIKHAPFDRFPEQIAFAIKQVKTPLWCVMDSDDVFHPTHMSKLVELYKNTKRKDEHDSPLYVTNDNCWEQHKNNFPKRRGYGCKMYSGWWCTLFEKIEDSFVDENFNEFMQKKKKDTGSDRHFIKDKEWHWEKYHNELATVLHRLGVGFHIRNEGWIEGYYKNSIEKVLNKKLEPIKPHWRKDYSKMIEEFNQPEVTFIMGTFQRNPEQMERAVNSFLSNDYKNKKLLITNSNPKRLWLFGFHPNVQVVDIPASDRVQEVKEALKYVETDFVSVIDDDDEVMPNHVSQLVTALKDHKFKNIINMNFIEHDTKTGKEKYHKKRMWWNGIYRTKDLKAFDIGDDMEGFDKRIMAAMNPIELDLPSTYIWKRNAVIHTSKYKHNTHEEKLARINKARANIKEIRPVTLTYLLEWQPEVTVCMCTYGAHKHKTEQTIKSFLDQTYKRAKLLILNTHHQEIEFDREYGNIEVIEMNGHEFESLAAKHEHLIKQVGTECWMMLDDDDIILPHHIMTLVQLHNYNKLNYHKKKNIRPCQSAHARKIIMNGGEYHYIKKGAGWTCALYDKVSEQALTAKFRTPHPKHSFACYDLRLKRDAIWPWHRKEISYPSLPTYIWRGGDECFHLSSIGTNDELNNEVVKDKETKANIIIYRNAWEPKLDQDYYTNLVKWLNEKEDSFFNGTRKQYMHLDMPGTMRKVEFEFICNFLDEHGIKKMVEFGCGASTLAFVARGYDVTSYETKQVWIDKVRLMLDRDCVKLYDGDVFDLQTDAEFVLIDGPDPPQTREQSYITVTNAKPKYIGCHDIFRKYEASFIKKYILANGYKEKQIYRYDGSTKKKFCGVGIYERID